MAMAPSMVRSKLRIMLPGLVGEKKYRWWIITLVVPNVNRCGSFVLRMQTRLFPSARTLIERVPGKQNLMRSALIVKDDVNPLTALIHILREDEVWLDHRASR